VTPNCKGPRNKGHSLVLGCDQPPKKSWRRKKEEITKKKLLEQRKLF
jgi:hypothetical protein